MKTKHFLYIIGIILLGTCLFFSCEKQTPTSVESEPVVKTIITTESTSIEELKQDLQTNNQTKEKFEYNKVREEQLVLLNEYVNTNGITVDTTNSESLNSTGFDVYEKKDYVNAIRFFREAVYLNQEYTFPHYNLACCLSLLFSQVNGNSNVIERYNLYPRNSSDLLTMMNDELYENLSIAFHLSKDHIEKSKSDSDLAFIHNQKRFQNLTSNVTISVGTKYNEMVFVEGGSFNFHDINITVEDFYISKYEITNEIGYLVESWAIETGLYQSLYYTSVPVTHEDGTTNAYAPNIFDFYTALFFCNTLSIKEGFKPIYYIDENRNEPFNFIALKKYFENLYNYNYLDIYIHNTADGYRLPTEVEWEYVARGGKYSKGYEYAGSDNPNEVAWYGTFYDDYTKFYPVGLKKANELGLFDMSGNIAELCIDKWNETPLTDEKLRNGKYFYTVQNTDSFVIKGGYNYDLNKHVAEEQTADMKYLNPKARKQMPLEIEYGDQGIFPQCSGLRLVRKI